MALELNGRSVDRFADRAMHRQLADEIRDQIRRGALRPGEALPSEGDIAKSTGLSRTAVRGAVDILTGEGLVTKRAGAASRVATPPPVRHVATSRYADELARLRALDGGEHPLTSAFVEDHGVAWDAHRVDATYAKSAATGEDAAWLDVEVGSPVLRRHLVKYVAEQPEQIQDSVIPLELVAGTPVEDPARQPWPGGTIAELYSVGLAVTSEVTEVRSRMPTADERRTLEMQATGPVWDVVRIFYVGERAAEASTVVTPAARMILRFETSLD